MVDAEVFLENFGSDRSHMLNPLTRQWNAKPPTYPCILTSRESNLAKYMTIDSEDIERRGSISVDEKHPFGVILSLSELRRKFIKL
jgi:N-terminal glutamine amidase